MKKKYFAVYMLIIFIALLSLPFAFGNWSQSVNISGYIKTAEIELEPKEDKNSDKDQNADKGADIAGKNDCEEGSDLVNCEGDNKSEQDTAQDKKDDGGTNSGVTDTTDEGYGPDLIPGDELNQKPVMPEDAPVPVEENDVEAEPESSSSPEPLQETAEDSMPENPAENPSNPDDESAETEADGEEISTEAEAVQGDKKPAESEPDTSPADNEDTKTDYIQD
jgi:hypothetical protein